MPALVLKKISRPLHASLKRNAISHHRSMTQEAIHLLEQGLGLNPADFPSPVRGRRPITQKLLDQAIRKGRA